MAVSANYDEALRQILAEFKAQIGTIHTLEPDGMLHMRAHTPGIPEPVLAASRVILMGALAAACGAGQKIEAGANQVDNSLDRSTKKVEKEANNMLDDDAGKRDAK
jgi:hypothetical protein